MRAAWSGEASGHLLVLVRPPPPRFHRIASFQTAILAMNDDISMPGCIVPGYVVSNSPQIPHGSFTTKQHITARLSHLRRVTAVRFLSLAWGR